MKRRRIVVAIVLALLSAQWPHLLAAPDHNQVTHARISGVFESYAGAIFLAEDALVAISVITGAARETRSTALVGRQVVMVSCETDVLECRVTYPKIVSLDHRNDGSAYLEADTHLGSLVLNWAAHSGTREQRARYFDPCQWYPWPDDATPWACLLKQEKFDAEPFRLMETETDLAGTARSVVTGTLSGAPLLAPSGVPSSQWTLGVTARAVFGEVRMIASYRVS